MGAQYSLGMLAPEWEIWLDEHGSLENLRAKFQDFRRLCSSRPSYRSNNACGDDFFITVEGFRQVRPNFPKTIRFVRASSAAYAWDILSQEACIVTKNSIRYAKHSMLWSFQGTRHD